MDVLVSDKTYFAFTEESDITGGLRDDKNVFVRKSLSEDYPVNPYVKVTGAEDWAWVGELNRLILHKNGMTRLNLQCFKIIQGIIK